MAEPVHGRGASADRGFALLIVLWWTVLLALLGTQLATSGRLEAQRAGNLRSAAMARAAADGALEETVFHLVDASAAGWSADGDVRDLPVVGGLAHVEVRSEAAKVGLNQASAGLLAALLTRLGTDASQSAALADAILDWRTATVQPRKLGAKGAEYRAAGDDYAPPNSDFETLDELRLVHGMTPDLVARLAPFVSVYQLDSPNLTLADAIVRRASADSGDVAAGVIERAESLRTEAPIVTIWITVRMTDGARAARHMVVRLALDASRHPFQVLDQD